MTSSWIWRFVGAAAVLAILVARTATAEGQQEDARVFTMCIPEIYWKDCVEMTKDSAKRGIPISCISARDRFECIERVGRKEADVVAVDPEDMYLAVKDNELASAAGYSVVEQVRTKEEPEAPYRYEAVAVIHKDLDIDSVEGLRGLKSCHTGVGRNVGYKIPITKLTLMGVLRNLNDPEYSARENELRALSSLFSKGCLVGAWSPDPTINRRLKETYSNMCALCEKPDVCDYPDIYSGYEGALRCLAHNGGDVAWTKVIYVKRFFGLPVGVSPAVPSAEDPSNFRYFCPDGSKVPIDATTKPCTWAARPWQGYMINGAVQNVRAVQKELTDLAKLGEEEKSDWWKDLLLLSEKTLAVAAPAVSPEDHLKNAKYMDVIERNSGAPERNARWCIWSRAALAKCRVLARAAFSRDARPRFDCLLEKSEEDCLKAVRDGGADLLVVEGGSVARAMKDYNARPIIAETYGPGSTNFAEQAVLAVVKSTSPVNGLADLRGKKSCHGAYGGSFAGWIAPLHVLKRQNLLGSAADSEQFFASSCAPGAPSGSKLCEQCVGNDASNDDRTIAATKCKPTPAENFYAGSGALRCLYSDRGDVAFVTLPALLQFVEEEKKDEAKLSDFKLVCPDGGVAPADQWQRCNLAMEPPRVILTSATKNIHAVEELTHGTLAASTLYSERPDLLQLFGNWPGQSNVLFKEDAKGLVSVDNSWDRWADWAKTQRDYVLP